MRAIPESIKILYYANPSDEPYVEVRELRLHSSHCEEYRSIDMFRKKYQYICACVSCTSQDVCSSLDCDCKTAAEESCERLQVSGLSGIWRSAAGFIRSQSHFKRKSPGQSKWCHLSCSERVKCCRFHFIFILTAGLSHASADSRISLETAVQHDRARHQFKNPIQKHDGRPQTCSPGHQRHGQPGNVMRIIQ